MPMSKSKDILPAQIHGENIIMILRSKVKVVNVRDTLYHGDTLDSSRAKQSMTMLKDKKA